MKTSKFAFVTNDQSIASTKTKYIKLNTKTQFLKITFNFCIHFKKENFFSPSVFLSPLSKCIKKSFSFKQQQQIWVLVFSFMYLVLVDPMDWSYVWQMAQVQVDHDVNKTNPNCFHKGF